MTNDNLKLMCHLMGGMIIILLAFQFYENYLFNLQYLYISLGAAFILVGLASRWIDKLIGKLSIVFFLAEAALFFYAGTFKKDDEDSIFNLIVIVSAVGYIVLAGYFLFMKSNKRKRRHSKTGSHVAKT